MRNEVSSAMKIYFRNELLRTRGERPQDDMAPYLEMSVRAYSDLETGKSCCRMDTFLLFLLICPDPSAFFRGLLDILAKLQLEKA